MQVQGLADGNAPQPRPKAAGTPERTHALERGEKGFLESVFRQSGGAQEPHEKAKHPGRVQGVQLGQRRLFAAQKTSGERALSAQAGQVLDLAVLGQCGS
jgi:hypothetical protein